MVSKVTGKIKVDLSGWRFGNWPDAIKIEHSADGLEVTIDKEELIRPIISEVLNEFISGDDMRVRVRKDGIAWISDVWGEQCEAVISWDLLELQDKAGATALRKWLRKYIKDNREGGGDL